MYLKQYNVIRIFFLHDSIYGTQNIIKALILIIFWMALELTFIFFWYLNIFIQDEITVLCHINFHTAI